MTGLWACMNGALAINFTVIVSNFQQPLTASQQLVANLADTFKAAFLSV